MLVLEVARCLGGLRQRAEHCGRRREERGVERVRAATLDAGVLERDGEYQMVKTGLSVRSTTDPIGRRRSPDHGQYAQMCSSQGNHGGFYCPGPFRVYAC